MTDDVSATARFEEALRRSVDETFELRLFVVGATPASRRAIANITAICTKYLAGRHTLEVIDIYQRPELAAEEDILGVPTLIRIRPEPVVRIVGDLSDERRVLAGLDLRAPDD
ncbi:MAG TPA: circadian clock KaiB family protein [Jatrophihabitans sp.]|jgi:circadian clock protein KaiB|uniref:circadian clock KaiB family protein n=1 Tax=Jatrophihabitans sp. TaxID=1932789 RepID=UPI002E09874F|nr:circadian clock KaiB family protein [Jatrophihabitans sp.]